MDGESPRKPWTSTKSSSNHVIAVSDEVARRSVAGECLTQLLHSPRGGGMLRDAHMFDAPALTSENHEHEQQAVPWRSGPRRNRRP